MISLNIVGHPDDDLLFLNPDILTDEYAYTVYMTAGDEGKDDEFIKRRMDAVENAYQGNGQKYGLIHLSLRSNLFPSDPYGDLYRFWNGDVTFIRSLEGTKWDGRDLNEWLVIAIQNIKPDIIRTHDPDTEPAIDHDEPHLDHIDHIYTAKFVVEAAKSFPNIPVYAYEGYPIRHKEANVEPELASKKLAMWRKYQEIDTSVAGEQWDIAAHRCYKRQIQ